MKTIVLLFTGLLMSLTTVSASEQHSEKPGNHLDITKRYRYAQPIVFVERGVEFFVFPDGSFDFNTNFEDTRYNNNNNIYYKGKRSKRRTVNTTYGSPNKRFKYTSHRQRGMQISHDRDGKVRRIGNVFLNYDRRGKIKRVGSVYMNYNYRKGTLIQVGGLRINYNHWGEVVNTRGRVKSFSNNCNFCGVSSCTTDHSIEHNNHNEWDNDDDYYNDDVYENNRDDNFYYYKQNGKVKKSKKNKR